MTRHVPAELELFPCVIPAGAVTNFEIEARNPFRADYFVVERPLPFEILDITIARTSQIRIRNTTADGGPYIGLSPPARDSIPASWFGVPVRLRFDVCAPGVRVLVRVKNISLEPAMFAAKFVGLELISTLDPVIPLSPLPEGWRHLDVREEANCTAETYSGWHELPPPNGRCMRMAVIHGPDGYRCITHAPHDLCTKCKIKWAEINDGDDALGPPVCCGCYESGTKED